MKRKIFKSLALLSVLIIIITALFTTVVFYNNSVQSMHRTVYTETQFLKTAYEFTGTDYLEEVRKQADINRDTRITLIEADGSVVFDNFADAATMDNHADRPEVQGALKKGYGEATRASDTLGKETYYYAVKLPNGSVMRVSSSIDTVSSILLNTLPWMLVAAAVAFLLALFLANWQTRRIVAPINRINLDAPESNEVYEELSPLLVRIAEQNQQIREQMQVLQLKQSEFAAITEHMSEGFLVVNDKAEVLSYNSAALRLLGLQTDPETGTNVLLFNRSNAFRSAVDTALRGLPFEQNITLSGKSYQLIANPVRQDDCVDGAVLVLLDITEREAREQLRREFSANVSHELKTPLTSISGYAEIIKNGMVKPADVPRFAEHIYNEAGRLITLIGDIIKLSQLDETAVELPEERVDLYAIAEDVIRRLDDMAKQKQVTLKLEGGGAVVRGAHQILDEMLFNLCDNAIRYNKPCGVVTVRVEETNEHVVLKVSDTGIGIPEADRERVFERFYRVDKSHSKEMGGTGLGLSIVKHGAQFHHASLSLDSREGAGTSITIVF